MNMKKISLLALSLLLCVFTLNAQEISFTFTANHTCEYAPLDSVMVENLTHGGDTVLYYPDTVLNVYSGIELQTAMENGFYVSQNYPNPFSSKTNLDVFVPEPDIFTINVYDVTGRQIVTYENSLEKGKHNFTFIAGNSSNYILTVNSTKNVQKILMIRVGAGDNPAENLTYNGIIPEEKSMLKSARSYFAYEIGDALKFTGFVDGDFEEINDTPSSDEDYVFDINNTVPSTPTAGTHISGEEEIEWNWNQVTDATGYKYSTSDDYATATDNGTSTSYTQTGLTCETPYTLYVWAYDNCNGVSGSVELAASTESCPPIECDGPLTDPRDGSSYQIMAFGNQCWMVENLNYAGNVNGNSWCYDDDPSNCDTYGRLYDWEAAMEGASASETNPSGVQGICPDGWHIPSDDEWKQLEGHVDSNYDYPNAEWDPDGARGYDAGSVLAGDATLWNDGSLDGHENFGDSGFDALPAGRRTNAPSFTGLGEYAYFWSTTEDDFFDTDAMSRSLNYNEVKSIRYNNSKTIGMSVRCVKD
ncbi:MAG: FISUMP domain-containing protein [Bacteroidota bacterium]